MKAIMSMDRRVRYLSPDPPPLTRICVLLLKVIY